MAYGKLAEGVKVFTAANGLADPADINEVQDQLHGMMGPLNVALEVLTCNQDTTLSPLHWDLRQALGYLAWQHSVVAVNPLWQPIGTLRVGQKITAMTVMVKGSVTGGSITLVRQPLSTPAAPVTTGTFPADPWNTAGAWTARAATFSGGSHTVLADFMYFLNFNGAASGTSEYYAGGWYTVQFGN